MPYPSISGGRHRECNRDQGLGMTTLIRKIQKSIAIAAIAAAGFTAGSVAVPDTAAAAADNNIGLPTLPVIIVNKSGTSEDLYVYIWAEYNKTNYYVSDTNGDVTPLTSTNKKYKKFGLNLGTKTKTKIFIPQVSSARFYLSFGTQMQVVVSSSGAPSTPIGWNTGSPNYGTLFDWMEYTWTPQENPPVPGRPGSALNANATQVDMLGIPMLITMKGIDANSNPVLTKAGFARPGTRATIFSTMSSAGTPWDDLIVTKGGTQVRLLAQKHGIPLGLFPSDQLDSYIDNVYTTFAAGNRNGQTVTAKTNAGGVDATFTGQVTSDNLVFTQSGQGNSGNTVTFPKPTTLEAYGAPTFSYSGSGTHLAAQAAQIQNFLQAALLRTTMLTYSTISHCPSNPKKAYYKNDPINVYAKTIHRWAYKNQAYAFAYDDNCNQSSDYTIFAPKKMTIKIPPFGKGMPADK